VRSAELPNEGENELAQQAYREKIATSNIAREGSRDAAHQIVDAIKQQPAITPEALARIRQRVAERQKAVGYTGDYKSWIEKFPAS